MNDANILNTIELLTARVVAKEEEVGKLKKLVNELCSEAGVPPRYEVISQTGGTALRSDEFYGQSLTAAVRNYLERRKASNQGAATPSEIFASLRDGGYNFETKNEEIAKIGLRSTLRKTSSIFHRLPNGQYGLLSWYPSAKAHPEHGSNRNGKHKAKRAPKSEKVTSKDIRDVVLAQEGNFKVADIEAAVKAKYPSKDLPKTKTATLIFVLKNSQKLIKEVSPRTGMNGAIYAKI